MIAPSRFQAAYNFIEPIMLLMIDNYDSFTYNIVQYFAELGQEVLVEFVDGDIDRPVIVGATYNGEGQPDAQGNRVNAGAAGATGNAPAWFPGSARQGAHEGHAHTATLRPPIAIVAATRPT